jgi:hypothetical protein
VAYTKARIRKTRQLQARQIQKIHLSISYSSRSKEHEDLGDVRGLKTLSLVEKGCKLHETSLQKIMQENAEDKVLKEKKKKIIRVELSIH